MRKTSFISYEDWWTTTLSKLDDDMRHKCLDAIYRYAFEGKEPEDPIVNAITGLMRSAIDRDTNKYERKVEQTKKAANARWERKHNADASKRNADNADASKRNAHKSPRIVSHSNNDNVNDNDNDNVNDNDNEGESKERSTPTPSGRYQSFIKWLEEKCPRLLTLQPMTEKEFNYIFSTYNKKEVTDTLLRMDNEPSIDKKNHYLYRALRKWLETNYKKE